MNVKKLQKKLEPLLEIENGLITDTNKTFIYKKKGQEDKGEAFRLSPCLLVLCVCYCFTLRMSARVMSLLEKLQLEVVLSILLERRILLESLLEV